MNNVSAQLLKRLEPAVRPVSTMLPMQGIGRAPIGLSAFDQLLSQAKSGAIESGRQVAVQFDAAPPLSASQLERLASAADQAEAAGSRHALMLIDGRAFVLDVKNRALMSEMSATGATSIQSVDAAVIVARTTDGESQPLKLPGSGVLSASVLKNLQLASLSNA